MYNVNGSGITLSPERKEVIMEKRDQNAKARRKLGKKAVRLLNITLPLVLLQAVGTAVYITLAEPFTLVSRADTVSFMLDRLGLALMLAVAGSLFYDLLDKRSSDR